MVKPACFDKNGMKKGAWSEEEDSKLRAYVERYGHWNWRLLPKYAGLARCGKSCRLRWVNYLKPGVRRGNFSRSEKELIIKLHQQFGNKWSAIAEMLPGRTDNDIKNYWNAHIKKNMNWTSIKESSSRQISDPDSMNAIDDEVSRVHNPQTSGSSTFNEIAYDNVNTMDSWSENEMRFWNDHFLADIVNNDNEYYLPAEGELFQHHIHDYSEELSTPISSFSTTCEWIADGDHNHFSGFSTSANIVSERKLLE